MAEILIQNGTVVNADRSFEADVLISGGVIREVGRGISAEGVKKVIDAKGMLIMPGGIDPHVHMELPFMGTVSKDDFYTGTRAALAGGTTMLIDFAIPSKGQSLLDIYNVYRTEKCPKACCDYGLHMGLIEWDDEKTPKEIQILCEEKGINSFKMFFAYKGALMISDENALKAMIAMKRHGALPMIHAENGDTIFMLQQRMIDLGITGPEGHAQSRPAYVEGEAVRRIGCLAQAAGCPIYVVHVMSRDAMEEVRAAKIRGVMMIGEAVLSGLTMDDSGMYAKDWLYAARRVMSPPLRSPGHREALLDALSGRSLDLVGTDHCTFDEKQKRMGEKDFRKIPNGMHGIEERMTVLWDLAVHRTGKLTPTEFVRVTSTEAARIFNIYPRKGVVQVGSDADLVIFDPKATKSFSPATHHMNLDFNAYEGQVFHGVPLITISQGRVAFDAKVGFVDAERGSGHFIPTPPYTPVFSTLPTRDAFTFPVKIDRPVP